MEELLYTSFNKTCKKIYIPMFIDDVCFKSTIGFCAHYMKSQYDSAWILYSKEELLQVLNGRSHELLAHLQVDTALTIEPSCGNIWNQIPEEKCQAVRNAKPAQTNLCITPGATHAPVSMQYFGSDEDSLERLIREWHLTDLRQIAILNEQHAIVRVLYSARFNEQAESWQCESVFDEQTLAAQVREIMTSTVIQRTVFIEMGAAQLYLTRDPNVAQRFILISLL